MNLFFNDTIYKNDIVTLFKAFYPFEVFETSTCEQSDFGIFVENTDVKVAYFSVGQPQKTLRLQKVLLDELLSLERKDRIRRTKTYLKGLTYDLLSEHTGKTLPWGILTGIRPTKLAFQLSNQLKDEAHVKKVLCQTYRMSLEKAELLIGVITTERPYVTKDTGAHSVYIGVPFCPSKCSYCTFPSYRSDQWPKAFNDYTETLLKEMEAGREWFRTCASVYIGGGTPTSLTEEDFEKVISRVRSYLGDREIEFTVEAGRPDTITTNKLLMMKKYGVSRISINPQTMQDRTLEAIGRAHDSQAISDCFEEARTLGFDHINMDLILGLPGETPREVADTLNQVVAMRPESITIHTLAFKRGSKMSEIRADHLTQADIDIHRSMDLVHQVMATHAYQPYYLYRQKQMVGQYENVGYCKPGHESIYNIRIMEEVASIVAFGAGAISKKVEDEKITRLDQPKDVQTYLRHINQIIEKKHRFFMLSS